VKVCPFQNALRVYTWTVMRKSRIYSKIHATYFKRFRIFLNVTSTEPRNITRKEVIRDLEWSNNNAELLPSRLQQWNRLDDTVEVTAFHSTVMILSSSS
jgi:hypothetical protein